MDVYSIDVNPIDVNPIDVNPIDVNPIEVYPIEAYLIGTGVVDVSGCHHTMKVKTDTEVYFNICKYIAKVFKTELVFLLGFLWY